MNNKWLQLTSEQIKKGENGNSFLSEFKADFLEAFGYEICETCPDFDNKLRSYQTLLKAGGVAETGWLLSPMYIGVQYPFGHPKHVTNENITLEDVQRLLPLHHERIKDSGVGIFDKTPEAPEATTPEVSEDDSTGTETANKKKRGRPASGEKATEISEDPETKNEAPVE